MGFEESNLISLGHKIMNLVHRPKEREVVDVNFI